MKLKNVVGGTLSKVLFAGVAALGVLSSVPASAAQLAFQGFETDTGDWTAPGGSITRTASGGGPLGVPAYQGGFYGTLHTGEDNYQSGYGYGGYSFFGFPSTPAYPGSPFTQSTAVYIDVLTPAPNDPSSPAFWIDNTPSSTSGSQFGGEHNFRLSYTGSSVIITADGNLIPSSTLTMSGWYLFDFTYSQGATPTSLSTTDLSIFTGGGTLLSTQQFLNNSDGETLLSQDLAGPGYTWLTVWQNGFSGDNLAIDSVQAFTGSRLAAVPEPLTLSIFGVGVVGAAALRRRKKAKA